MRAGLNELARRIEDATDKTTGHKSIKCLTPIEFILDAEIWVNRIASYQVDKVLQKLFTAFAHKARAHILNSPLS